MARKDILKGLIAETGSNPADAAPSPAPSGPRMGRGAIGAVSRSIAALRTRALEDVPADLIDNAGLTDRLDEDDDIDALAESIRQYGQQVPVLLRHSPNHEGRYEVVYGRRRVAALKRLGQPVRAMIRDIPDRELIIAQGQENAARKELTFIEKANFARQMVAMGFERRVVCDALHIDKTLISRMLKVAEAVPEALIRRIGSAPSIGRDRWLALAERIKGREEEALALAEGPNSDARFEAVFAGLAPARRAKPPEREPPAPPRPLRGADGRALGEAQVKGKRVVIALDRARAEGFDDWLVEHMEEIHRRYLEERGGE